MPQKGVNCPWGSFLPPEKLVRGTQKGALSWCLAGQSGILGVVIVIFGFLMVILMFQRHPECVVTVMFAEVGQVPNGDTDVSETPGVRGDSDVC